MFLERILPIVFILFGASCAIPTPCGPNSGLGGYIEQQIDEDSYLVGFNGNEYASEERVWNFWIYRCAELTRLKGFDYFSLTPLDKTSKSDYPNRPGGKLYEFGRVDQSILNDLTGINGKHEFEEVDYIYYTVTT